MEWILLLACVAAIIFLFVSGGRMRVEIDKLQSDVEVATNNLGRLTKLYESLARGGAPAAAAASPSAPAAPQAAEAPVAPAVSEPAAPPEPPAAAEAPAPSEPSPVEEPAGDIPPHVGDEPEPAAAAMDAPPPPQTPPRRFEWERFIGVRLPVWIGAVALCIAGFFFVSYAIESGLFGPELRVLAAAAAGLAFLAGGEFVRRRARTANSARIAAALASAAIATFYATAYIASVLYGFIPEPFGFAAMAGVTALAIAIALVFGQAVALVGLFGGYLTPALFESDTPSALLLFGYLLAVHVAFFAIIKARSWWHLTLPALFGPFCWIGLWLQVIGEVSEPLPAAAFLILLPVVVAIAAYDTWRDDAEPLWLVGGKPGWARRALPLATALAAFGFLAFTTGSGNDIVFWQALIVFGALAIAAAFLRPTALGYLQLLPLVATIIGLFAWRQPGVTEIAFVTGVAALVFGFGALDQLRRLKHPAIWSSALAFLTLAFFVIALFKIAGWQSALAQKHFWAASALLLAAALMGVLWYFGPKVAGEKERSRVYAALAGAVTTLVSLGVVLELDPELFPAASAVAVLGLAAVHTRVPVRGLRILAIIYAIVYALLALGAGGEIARLSWEFRFVFARSLRAAPFVLLILPGLAFVGAATLFARTPRPDGKPDLLVIGLDLAALLTLALGLLYQLSPDVFTWMVNRALVVSAPLFGPLALLAAAAIFVGRTYRRQALYYGGLVLTAIVALAMVGRVMRPLADGWPPYEVPSFLIFDAALAAIGLPALVFLGIGWFVRQDPHVPTAHGGRAISVFAVFALYVLLLIEIRAGFHPDQLQGEMGSAENYTYSVATLIFGILLLVIGVVIRNRGARALSLVFVLAATVKVFLFDAASLEGLWRVASFLGMGLSFLGISWAYARYVFGLGRGKPPPLTAAPAAPAAT